MPATHGAYLGDTLVHVAEDDDRHPVGLTRDAGWQIGVQRSIPAPVGDVWDFLTSPDGLDLWLGPGARPTLETGSPYRTADGTEGRVRSVRPGDRLRVSWRPADWDHDSIVQVAVAPNVTGTAVRFHQERLSGPDERSEMRAHWTRVLGTLAHALA